MNPRIRRLEADHQQIVTLLSNHPRIRIVGMEGSPPEKYALHFDLSGLTPVGEAGCDEKRGFGAEIFLSLDYPRRPPFCRMTTPIFHPNIDASKICIGDHWSAGQRLIQLIVRIGEMITFQSYNVQSPLNARAAAWAEKNLDRLPLEKVDLSAGL
jgi:ubiquitin-protein ligase